MPSLANNPSGFLRLHWFDIGPAFSVAVCGYLLDARPTGLALLLWASLASLFLHQFEEYRYPGYFPGMLNTALFRSQWPDRYPLNANTAFVVNVTTGWLVYLLAAILNTQALWLGIAAILISLGNVLAHTFLFNIKGKTVYNPGMVTALVLLLPISSYFLYLIVQSNAASPLDWVLGLVLGGALNYIGVLKLIDWLKDENTRYLFPARCLMPATRE